MPDKKTVKTDCAQNENPKTNTSKSIAYFGWFLLIASLRFYIHGQAIHPTLCSIDTIAANFNGFLSTWTGSIQALLITNLGIQSGISVAKPDSTLAKSLRIESSKLATIDPVPPSDINEKIQIAALVIYVVRLVICMVVWTIKIFRQTINLLFLSGIRKKCFSGVVLANSSFTEKNFVMKKLKQKM